MPRIFSKSKECGCVVKTILCGIQDTPNGKMYLLGSHDHIVICSNCQKYEQDGDNDSLHDMWMNDNMTNEFGYGGWKELIA